MESSYSPPVLYLTDDDDNDTEHHRPYSNSLPNVFGDTFTCRKRKLTNPNDNVRINPSIVNWSKRHRYDNYYPPHVQPTTLTSVRYESATDVINPHEYLSREPESHSFLAFDWTNETQKPSGIYSHPIQSTPRRSFAPPPPFNVMNVTKHHLDHSDTVPLPSMIHHNETYLQSPQRNLINMPMSSSSPSLPLPLPTPTSSIIRPTAQRIQPGKTLRMPYSHPIQPVPLPIHRQHIKGPVFQPRFHPPSPPVPLLAPTVTSEIRRQPLNGTGVLSAFYDSKCYRCNICKFESPTSSIILQHIFTHIFFCPQCPFYTYSHHSLYQHSFEKHKSNHHNDNIDPKNVDLLYITRCSDGTFALCMDTSTPPAQPPPPPPPPPPPATKPIVEQINPIPPVENQKPKRRLPRKRNPKPKNKVEEDDDIVVLAEKRDIHPQPSSSSITRRSVHREKQPLTYVLMKHRRCYSIRNPPCLHSLTLEYNICREHTIRHMCQTQGILKRRKLKVQVHTISLIDEAAKCLKTLVNDIVNMEENRTTPDLVCLLPNNVINSILSVDDLDLLTNILKLNNKYDVSMEQNNRNKSEYFIRQSNQHNFILSACGLNKVDQTILTSSQATALNMDSIYTQTDIDNLQMLNDNTHLGLKDIDRSSVSSTFKPVKKKNITQASKQSTKPEPVMTSIPASPRSINHHQSTSPKIDRNNNSVTSSISNVIILD